MQGFPLAVKSGSTEILYLYGQDGLVAARINGTWYYVLKDHLGSTKVAVNGSGTVVAWYDYDPYGKIVDSYVNAALKNLFTGHEQEIDIDDEWLWNFRARQFDSQIGLFYAADPARQTYSPQDYALNNPVSFVDRTGRVASDDYFLNLTDMKWLNDWHAALYGGGRGVNFSNPTDFGGSGVVSDDELMLNELIERLQNDPRVTNFELGSGGWLYYWVRDNSPINGKPYINSKGEAALPAIDVHEIQHSVWVGDLSDLNGGHIYAGVEQATDWFWNKVGEWAGWEAPGVVRALSTPTPTSVGRSSSILGHIFKNSPGHVNPSTLASQDRFIKLFEKVANNPANLRTDAFSVNLIERSGVEAGVQVYTQTFNHGQVWVYVRNGKIFDAGVNTIAR